jgi:FHS family glucose/mannose:H+ symporter-like MFS transporter
MHLIQRRSDAPPVSSAAYAALYAGFVIAGVATTLMGPLLPVLIARWTLNDQRAGLFFTAQFCGSMAGVVSLNWMMKRGYRLTFVCGFLLIASGVAGLKFGQYMLALASAGVLGFGLGQCLSATNLWVAEVARDRVAALSILNLMWGIGAVASAPLVMLAQLHGTIANLLYGIAACSVVTSAVLAALRLEPQTTAPTQGPGIGSTNRISTRSAISLGALFFLYIGSENSVAGWVASLTKRMNAVSGDSSALAPMFFWAGLLAGRALVPLIPLRRSERKLFDVALLLAAIGISLLLTSTRFIAVAVSVTAAGLGMAAIYPILIAWLVKAYGERSRQTGSIMFALASMGGATMPWMVGAISTRVGSLRAGLLIPLAGCAAMFILIIIMTEPVFRGTDKLKTQFPLPTSKRA